MRKRHWPVLFDDLSYEGRLYALPLSTVVSMYYYNKQQFAERGIVAPNSSWSWEKEGIVELKKLSMDLNGDGVLDRWGLGLSTEEPAERSIRSSIPQAADRCLTKKAQDFWLIRP